MVSGQISQVKFGTRNFFDGKGLVNLTFTDRYGGTVCELDVDQTADEVV